MSMSGIVADYYSPEVFRDALETALHDSERGRLYTHTARRAFESRTRDES